MGQHVGKSGRDITYASLAQVAEELLLPQLLKKKINGWAKLKINLEDGIRNTKLPSILYCFSQASKLNFISGTQMKHIMSFAKRSSVSI